MLDGIPPAPRGTPQVEVMFDIDANGILSVKAKEKTTGKEQSIRIEGSSGLSKEDIEKMKTDAAAHADDDAKKKQMIEMKNAAEQLVYAAEKALKDHGTAVSGDIAKNVQEKIDALKSTKEGNDMVAIKNASEALSAEMQKIGEAMASAGGSSSSGGKETGDKKPETEGGVRDADYKEDKNTDGDGEKK